MPNILQIGNIHFNTNSAIFKIEICGTLFNHYLQEKDALLSLRFI